MNDFFKYLTPSQEDIHWGLHLNVAGFKRVVPGEEYPSRRHPSGYYFKWETGRILHEFQIIYISEGAGILETRSGSQAIQAGSMILIHPETWHRYKPDPQKGWVEMYVGFNGPTAAKIMSHPLLSKTMLLCCGLKEDILDCYNRIYEIVKPEKPGFQLVAAGLVVMLAGRLVSGIKYQRFEGTPAETIVEQTKFLMQQNLECKIDFKEISGQHNISYSGFRKLFKKYTGISPHQYHLNLRILKAKELLLMTEKPVKQVAVETGFESESYFSRCFKEKTGILPTDVGRIAKPQQAD